MTKVIAVDFDGTLCENKFPEIGKPNLLVIMAALAEQEKGAKLILWTCRTGKELDEAVAAAKEWGLTFDAVNENLPERIEMFGNDGVAHEKRCLILWHEILHGICEHAGLGVKNEEVVVDTLAKGIYQVLQDNGGRLFDLKEVAGDA